MQCVKCDRTLNPKENETEKHEHAPFCDRCKIESINLGKPNEVAVLKKQLRLAGLEIERLNHVIEQLTSPE